MTNQLMILTVSQVNRQIRSWLEQDVSTVCVQGEVSNLSKPASGHYYFCLKDAKAQLRCVYFKNRSGTLDLKTLANGLQVIAKGKLSLYETRGDFQLIVDELSEAGIGDLCRQFEALKLKLANLGLFEQARKKPIPAFPHHIGIITSPTAAALQDILSTLKRRYPLAKITFYPSEVQGKEAPKQLCLALERAQKDAPDVIVLARGGGSIEDLWAFNDEALAHAIVNSFIPIVTGVGHETDFTIADFVADLRAETPTAAAVAVTPDKQELLIYTSKLETQLKSIFLRYLNHCQQQLKLFVYRFLSPKYLVVRHNQTVDYSFTQLHKVIQKKIQWHTAKMQVLTERLNALNPKKAIEGNLFALDLQIKSLRHFIFLHLTRCKQQLEIKMASLHGVSPLATLERGYAIASVNHKVIYNSAEVSIHDQIEVRLAKGNLWCEIIGKNLE